MSRIRSKDTKPELVVRSMLHRMGYRFRLYLKDLPGKHAVEISRTIKKLIKNKMLTPTKENGRKYVLRFDNNYLLRGIIRMLDKEGFLPLKGEAVSV